jgi:hypothetical protein
LQSGKNIESRRAECRPFLENQSRQLEGKEGADKDAFTLEILVCDAAEMEILSPSEGLLDNLA